MFTSKGIRGLCKVPCRCGSLRLQCMTIRPSRIRLTADKLVLLRNALDRTEYDGHVRDEAAGSTKSRRKEHSKEADSQTILSPTRQTVSTAQSFANKSRRNRKTLSCSSCRKGKIKVSRTARDIPRRSLDLTDLKLVQLGWSQTKK